MSLFEVKSVHISSFLSDGEINENNGMSYLTTDPYRLINIQVKVNSEQKNSREPSKEEIAAQLAQAIEQIVANLNFRNSSIKIKNITSFKNQEEISENNEFGWYELL